MAAIKPGNFKELSDEGNEDYAGFEGSMAHEIEKQLNQLLDRDHLPTLPPLYMDLTRAIRRCAIAAVCSSPSPGAS